MKTPSDERVSDVSDVSDNHPSQHQDHREELTIMECGMLKQLKSKNEWFYFPGCYVLSNPTLLPTIRPLHNNDCDGWINSLWL